MFTYMKYVYIHINSIWYKKLKWSFLFCEDWNLTLIEWNYDTVNTYRIMWVLEFWQDSDKIDVQKFYKGINLGSVNKENLYHLHSSWLIKCLLQCEVNNLYIKAYESYKVCLLTWEIHGTYHL